MIAKQTKIIMNDNQFVERLMVLADRKTYYRNKYPDNLCYIHADGRTSADCVNLLKAIFNGYDVHNNTPSYYQRDLSNTGDCTEAELIGQCSDVSEDFTKLGTRPRVLYMSGHIGAYLGREIVKNGYTYNVIECTAAWGGGILYSYVRSDGKRVNRKGGVLNGTWKKHGLPSKWVCESEVSKPTETPKVDFSKYPVLKKGSRGEYVYKLQELLVKHGYNPNGIDGIFGNGCLKAVKQFQSDHKDINGVPLVVDGYVGQKTWGALYS